MRFWDSSAIIPLCVKERASDAVRKLMEDDGVMAVWWITRVECLSALSRRLREGMLTSDDERNAKKVLSALMDAWSEVQATETVRQRAERLLSIHPLKSADSLQLAAALIWAQESPQGL